MTYVALLETCLHVAEGVSTNISSWEAKRSQARHSSLSLSILSKFKRFGCGGSCVCGRMMSKGYWNK